MTMMKTNTGKTIRIKDISRKARKKTGIQTEEKKTKTS